MNRAATDAEAEALIQEYKSIIQRKEPRMTGTNRVVREYGPHFAGYFAGETRRESLEVFVTRTLIWTSSVFSFRVLVRFCLPFL